MKPYKNSNHTYTCEIYVRSVLCICEANKRHEARKGALEMARRRAGK